VAAETLACRSAAPFLEGVVASACADGSRYGRERDEDLVASQRMDKVPQKTSPLAAVVFRITHDAVISTRGRHRQKKPSGKLTRTGCRQHSQP